ncbi:hypothetical protein LOK49_LG12G00196 [Camellia lanceoleosa]|uniref:Uncharacterized protein n=1 Tax=Camellia lanceoleosa TaxID=1840588 RepID=A0ACC0FWD0_9ERIC|nr:hypothetical protein LOK49_LG12G00196 [Camellia lanceoleosa]
MIDKSLEAKLVERQGKVEQLDEIRKQLEKERDFRCEEATKELNNVKLEVESMRRDLESRQAKIAAVVAEVDTINMKINSIKESGAVTRQELGLTLSWAPKPACGLGPDELSGQVDE